MGTINTLKFGMSPIIIPRGGYIGFTPSVRPSLCPASRVRSVAPTVLDGSISYLYILSSNFRSISTIMGNHGVAGVSQNAGVLVVLILPWDPFY